MIAKSNECHDFFQMLSSIKQRLKTHRYTIIIRQIKQYHPTPLTMVSIFKYLNLLGCIDEYMQNICLSPFRRADVIANKYNTFF